MADDEISALIGTIYDAALDPQRWPEVLETTSRFVNGGPAMLFSQDPLRRSGQLYAAWNVEAAFASLYFDDILKTNPLLPLTTFLALEDPFAISTLMPYDELQASRFFQEYMQPQDMVDIVGSVLDKSPRGHVIVGFGRSHDQGLGDTEANRWMGLLAPHYRRAVSIGRLIDHQQVEAQSLIDVLDGFAAGIFLVGAAGQLIRANRRGRAMLEDPSAFGLAHKDFASGEPRALRQLREAFVCAGTGHARGVGVAIELQGVSERRPLAHILPLTTGGRRSGYLQCGAVAAVFVSEAGVDAAPALETVAQAFDLTPAEVRVLHALVSEAGGVAAVAAVTGIAASTVKTHLSHLFAKTGTRRQSELVKLVVSYASPLDI
jgi:DNA-binding CsgD family transcriptional regulator